WWAAVRAAIELDPRRLSLTHGRASRRERLRRLTGRGVGRSHRAVDGESGPADRHRREVEALHRGGALGGPLELQELVLRRGDDLDQEFGSVVHRDAVAQSGIASATAINATAAFAGAPRWRPLAGCEKRRLVRTCARYLVPLPLSGHRPSPDHAAGEPSAARPGGENPSARRMPERGQVGHRRRYRPAVSFLTVRSTDFEDAAAAARQGRPHPS